MSALRATDTSAPHATRAKQQSSPSASPARDGEPPHRGDINTEKNEKDGQQQDGNKEIKPLLPSSYQTPPHLQTCRKRLEQVYTEMKARLVAVAYEPPLASFMDLGSVLPIDLLEPLNARFPCPTRVQKVVIPLLLKGTSLVVKSGTGTGKTLAYAVPMLAHLVRQNGETALVVAPTRELAAQLAHVIRVWGGKLGIAVVLVVGGGAKHEQRRRVKGGKCRVVVGTPGRLLDVGGGEGSSFVVLDEADRMLDMGFGKQVREVLERVRKDAQRVLVSATGGREVNKGFGDVKAGKVEIGEGGVGEGVEEEYVVVEGERERGEWLKANMEELIRVGGVMVFCASRGMAAGLANDIRGWGWGVACLHGEVEQRDREGLLRMFREGEVAVLVTTDLSARGLDIGDVANVINFGCAKSWEWHVHRVGRTGRAGRKGKAWTVLVRRVKADMDFGKDARRRYERSGGQLPKGLEGFGWWGRGDGGRGKRGRW